MSDQLTLTEKKLESVERSRVDAKPHSPKPDLHGMNEFERARIVSKTWSMGQD